MGWRCGGIRWAGGVPALGWRRGVERRESALVYGRELAFRAVGARECVGARGNVCPVRAAVPGRSTGGRCAECARLERAHSVAADTVADDPRVYRVYLAWFGPGMVKVGITAEERGAARLLEQGAVAFSWLGRGPLMAARRTEELLRTALGVPDRVPYARKRAVRSALPEPDLRAAEILRMYESAAALEGWPPSLERIAFAAADHAGAFGLAGLPPATGVVGELVDGGCVAGRLIAAAGPDLHLATAGGPSAEGSAADGSPSGGGVTVLDTRLMTGWELTGCPGGGTGSAAVTVPVIPVHDPRRDGVQDGLF
ncbi:DUF2797 domain-containing protein [Streptomyces sp. NPDC091212]|uniref:DUF2797 domain-containing protein n=1 Tax=Streptomyces sp. NPDC091212 TaxID=3155191 RepID=UPI003447C83B